MIRDELLERLRGPETGDFEVKAAQFAIPEDAYKTVSAFANTSGGWLVLGVTESEDGFQVEGVDDPDRLQNDFLTTCRSSNKFNNLVDVTVSQFQVGDAHVLAFRVEALPRFDKPLRVRIKRQWQTYIRVGSGDHRCSEVEESRFLRDASYETFDSTLCGDARIEDLDPEAVKWLRNALAQRHALYRSDDGDMAAFLSMASILREDRPTFAAVLLFGKTPLISRHKPVGMVDFRLIWRDLDQAPPDYRWDDRVFCESHLVDALRTLLERFYRLAPRPFELDPNGVQHRAESTDYLAVREALVNLLVHQDYTDQHRVARILWYRDRVIFENPGDSFLDAEEMERGGTSSPRNPKLVQLLRQAGYAEQAGEGIRNIFRTWERADRPRPVIENDPGRKLYRLTLPWPDQGRPAETATLGGPPEPRVFPVASGREPETEGPRIAISRLPVTGEHFVGRDDELARLDAAWDDPATNVISLVAFGGVGKTALVNRWLDRLAADGWRNAERVLGWSFYSQGAAAGASSEGFTEFALDWLGYGGEVITSPRKKGEVLARLVRSARTLLLLDGIEPLQHPPGSQTGRLKDPTLQALVRELAAHNPGLCVITTRLSVADTAGRAGVSEVDLEQLPPTAGAELLRRLGVEGATAELEEASEALGGNALALSLLGTYLRDVFDGDVRRLREVPLLDEQIELGGHARRVMASYEAWLGEGPEIQVLRLLGLFDGPAGAAALKALRGSPVIPGLTEGLGEGAERRWRQALARLRKARFVVGEDAAGAIEAHPLVRAYFGERLREERPEAWRAGRERLDEYRQTAGP